MTAAALLLLTALFVSAGGSGGGSSGGGVASDALVVRPEGRVLGADDPILTAIRISEEGWPDGASSLVLCSVEDEGAAAVAGPLATAVEGPVLVATAENLDSVVLDRIEQMQVKTVHLLDSGTFTAGYAAELESRGLTVEESTGSGHVALSGAVAQRIDALTGTNGVVIVSAEQTRRAVIAGGFASAMGMPVLLVEPGAGIDAHSGLIESLSPRRITICATETVLPNSLFEAGQFDGALRDRVDGVDDSDFSRTFAEYAFAHGLEYEYVLAVREDHFRHAYAVPPLAAGLSASLILTEADALGTSATEFFLAHASAIKDVRFVGPPGADIEELLATAKDAAETRISADALPLEDAVAERITSVTSETVTFSTDSALESQLVVGKIIVSGEAENAPDGLLRRILSVQVDGSEVVVETEQASLSDVIEKGSFDIRISAEDFDGDESVVTQHPGALSGPQPIARGTSGSATMALSQVDPMEFLQTSTKRSVESDRLRIEAPLPGIKYETPEFPLPQDIGESYKFLVELDAKQTWEAWYVVSGSWEDQPRKWGLGNKEKLVEFGIVAYLRHEFDLDYEVGFEVRVKGGTKKGDQRELSGAAKQKLQGQTRAPAHSVRSYFQIHVIPVVLDSYLEPYVGATCDVKGVMKGRYSKHVELWAGGKLRLDTGRITPVYGARDYTPPMAPPTYEKEIEAKLAAGLKIGTRFYGVVGPYVRGELHLKVTGKDPVPAGEHPLTLVFGWEATFGGDLKILWWEIGNIEIEPVSGKIWEWPDGSPPPAAGTPPSGGGGGRGGGSGSSATSLVFDISGSMSDWSAGRTKMDAARDAGQTVLDIMTGHAGGAGEVGVAVFSDGAQSLVPLSGDFAAVRAAISGLGPTGGTDMRAGLAEGVGQLSGSNAADKAMFFLSDGVDTSWSTRDDILAEARRAASQSIVIYTIGFGDPGSLDEDLLREIAQVTGGTYAWADASAAMALVGQFAKSQIVRSGATPVFETQGTVAQGATAYLGMATVPPDHGNLEVVLAWPGSDLDVILLDPAGAEVDEGYPGFTVTKTERTAQVTVESATPGDWELSVYGTQTSMPEEPFYALAAFRETTGTVSAGGGGTAGNDGSGMLFLLLIVGGGAGVAALVVGQRRSSGVVPDPSTGQPDASEISDVALVLLDEKTGVHYELHEGANAIGRSSDNDAIITHPSVSRHHAVFVVSGSEARIKDLKSTSGVYVDDRRVEGSAKVRPGARVKLGEVTLLLEEPTHVPRGER